jgi:prepilin-type N-terminal cleavage/methylation domain-containing protein
MLKFLVSSARRCGFPNGFTPGFTLIELVVVLSLLTLVVAGVFPALMDRLDHLAVVAAREEIVGLFHQARAVAVAKGGASVLLTSQPSTLRLESGKLVHSYIDLENGRDVRLSFSRSRSEVELSFDPLGLGRVASQTLTLSRGSSTVRLVISSYGRLERK